MKGPYGIRELPCKARHAPTQEVRAEFMLIIVVVSELDMPRRANLSRKSSPNCCNIGSADN